jgi:hypothetical protein
MTNEMKSGIDVAAVAGGIGSWLALIPDIAALLSIVWLALRIGENALRIWESDTVKRWTGRD